MSLDACTMPLSQLGTNDTMDKQLICVSPKGFGWILHRKGSAESFFFDEKAAAMVCATTWAHVHQPSQLLIRQHDGSINTRTFR
jgi:hypothetical protein